MALDSMVAFNLFIVYSVYECLHDKIEEISRNI